MSAEYAGLEIEHFKLYSLSCKLFCIDDSKQIKLYYAQYSRYSSKIYDIIEISILQTHARITIGDTNDNSPVFNQSKYMLYISENIGHDTAVFNITATDADKGQNAFIEYSIIGGNNAGQFSMASKVRLTTDDNVYYFLFTL